MLASAGETPSPTDAIAAVYHFSVASRCERTADYHVGAIAIEAVEALAREEREEHRRFASDHHDPSSRAVGCRQRLDDLHAGGHVDVETAVTLRHEHAEASCSLELRHQIERKPAAGVDLRTACANRRREIAHRIEQGLRGWGHGAPLSELSRKQKRPSLTTRPFRLLKCLSGYAVFSAFSLPASLLRSARSPRAGRSGLSPVLSPRARGTMLLVVSTSNNLRTAGESSRPRLYMIASGRRKVPSWNSSIRSVPRATSFSTVIRGTIAHPSPISTARLMVSMLSNSST